MTRVVEEGALLWEPSSARLEGSRLTEYVEWLRGTGASPCESFDYAGLWEWSVDDLPRFWRSIWDHFSVRGHSGYTEVLGDQVMPGATWFAGATLNYAEHALQWRGGEPAIVAYCESSPPRTVSRSDLRAQVAGVAAGLRELGVRPGDRVVGYLPNIPEAIVAFLATASLGAVWSCCASDFGARSVLDRFSQIEPAVLIAADGYEYGGKAFPRSAVVEEIRRGLPSLRATVIVPNLGNSRDVGGPGVLAWDELFREPGGEPAFEAVPFDHPLWIVYSSGTTGLPKPIVHGHGGILLEHLKCNGLHLDVHEGDRVFWFSSTGWVVWNIAVSNLALGATLVLYDGNPGYPDLNTLWRVAADSRATLVGAGAPIFHAHLKAGLDPKSEFDLSSLSTISSTGAPLSSEAFAWMYDHVRRDVLVASASGGTDTASAFVGGCAWLPVRAGEIQCRQLGADVHAFDPAGQDLVDEIGELVVTAPMPSMPISFWNDPDGRRYRESYFEMYPGVWRHGDWIKITKGGACVIYGRSDMTLKRSGVRMGTSEFYATVEALPEVADSLVVDTGTLDDAGELLMFVVPAVGTEWTDELATRIRRLVREQLSPRHVPDRVVAVPEIPRTLTGKKLEIPVKRIMQGVPVEEAVSLGAVANPDALRPFLALRPERDGGA